MTKVRFKESAGSLSLKNICAYWDESVPKPLLMKQPLHSIDFMQMENMIRNLFDSNRI